MIYKCTSPHHTEYSAVFDPKQHDTHAFSLFTKSCLKWLFFSFPKWKKREKKVLKGKCFADVEEVKQKTAEELKGIKIYKFKKCFEQCEKCLNRCVASNGEHFEGNKFKNVRINTPFFINSGVFWSPFVQVLLILLYKNYCKCIYLSVETCRKKCSRAFILCFFL